MGLLHQTQQFSSSKPKVRRPEGANLVVLLGEKTDLVVQKFLQEHESTSAPRHQNDQKGRKGREATEKGTFPKTNSSTLKIGLYKEYKEK